MRIGLTFDLRPEGHGICVCGDDSIAEFDTAPTIQYLEEAISALGHEVHRIGNIRQMLIKQQQLGTLDIVFNICEGASGISREGQAPALLDALGVPYTFSDPLTMGMCLHKMTAKRIFKQGGISTPAAVLVASVSELSHMSLPQFPLFVKPSHEGTSKGIDDRSVVQDRGELSARVKFINETYHQCALIEEFVTGQEITVGIVGTGPDARVIGSATIRLKDQSKKVYGIYEKELSEAEVSYEVNTDPGSEVAAAALRAYRILGCRDAGRVDAILPSSGEVTVLEVNPLPGLHPAHSDLPIIATEVGIGYSGLIEEILTSALRRRGQEVGISDFHLSTASVGADHTL